jgi:hypothetical protein
MGIVVSDFLCLGRRCSFPNEIGRPKGELSPSTNSWVLALSVVAHLSCDYVFFLLPFLSFVLEVEAWFDVTTVSITLMLLPHILFDLKRSTVVQVWKWMTQRKAQSLNSFSWSALEFQVYSWTTHMKTKRNSKLVNTQHYQSHFNVFHKRTSRINTSRRYTTSLLIIKN